MAQHHASKSPNCGTSLLAPLDRRVWRPAFVLFGELIMGTGSNHFQAGSDVSMPAKNDPGTSNWATSPAVIASAVSTTVGEKIWGAPDKAASSATFWLVESVI